MYLLLSDIVCYNEADLPREKDMRKSCLHTEKLTQWRHFTRCALYSKFDCEMMLLIYKLWHTSLKITVISFILTARMVSADNSNVI